MMGMLSLAEYNRDPFVVEGKDLALLKTEPTSEESDLIFTYISGKDLLNPTPALEPLDDEEGKYYVGINTRTCQSENNWKQDGVMRTLGSFAWSCLTGVGCGAGNVGRVSLKMGMSGVKTILYFGAAFGDGKKVVSAGFHGCAMGALGAIEAGKFIGVVTTSVVYGGAALVNAMAGKELLLRETEKTVALWASLGCQAGTGYLVYLYRNEIGRVIMAKVVEQVLGVKS